MRNYWGLVGFLTRALKSVRVYGNSLFGVIRGHYKSLSGAIKDLLLTPLVYSCGVLTGKLTGLPKSTDHPSTSQNRSKTNPKSAFCNGPKRGIVLATTFAVPDALSRLQLRLLLLVVYNRFQAYQQCLVSA